MIVKRPLVWTSICLVSGTALASVVEPPFVPLGVAFLLSWSLAVIFILFKKQTPAAIAALAAAFLLGTCSYLLKAYVLETPDQLAQHYASDTSRRARLHGVVKESRISPDGGRKTLILDVDRIETDVGGVPVDSRVSGRTRVNWYEPAATAEPGDIVWMSGKLRLLTGFKNPRTWDYERYMHRKGTFTHMYAHGPDAVTLQGGGGLSRPGRLREYFRREGLRIVTRATRTEETRAFLAAILLGERGLLTDEMENWFKRTGTFHVLAISGLHVGLVYLIVSLALTPLPIGIKGRVALSIAVVWIYAISTGASVSVVRASIMLTLVLSGYYLSRDGDFLTSVALAALIIVGIDPLSIDDLGFQLSFTAVVLLCTFEPFYSERFYPLLREKLQAIPTPVLNRLAITMFASVVIGVGMLPLLAYHFNLISFVFPIANLIVIPILSLVLASGFACLLAGLAWIEAAAAFGLLAEAFAWIIFWVVKLCSLIPGGAARVVSPPLWILGLEALAIALVWWRPLSLRRVAPFAAVGVLVIAMSYSGRSPADTLRATFLDVGDADACFLELPSGGSMLVDTGFATPNLDCGEHLIAPFLWKKGRSTIDTLVLTHPDTDHTGGALFLVENFRMGQIWIPDTGDTPPEFVEILEAAKERGFPVRKMTARTPAMELEEVLIEVLNPPPDAASLNLSDNNLSLALRMTYRDISFLLPGDAEKKASKFMIESGEDLRSDILKASHHGLRSGFDRRFLNLVQPRVVVISGKARRVNQSTRERIDRYAPLCDAVFCTKDCGAVVIETDGHEIATRVTRKSPKELF